MTVVHVGCVNSYGMLLIHTDLLFSCTFFVQTGLFCTPILSHDCCGAESQPRTGALEHVESSTQTDTALVIPQPPLLPSGSGRNFTPLPFFELSALKKTEYFGYPFYFYLHFSLLIVVHKNLFWVLCKGKKTFY